ncbi:hypothetical protein FNV43_RR23981 [Rhamnella rubrinervis]|uniref:Cation/H+ exchanger domain-containing protein n=1 Tax=Rhamnella rubrinervis TaxID=2594499 RepID=A0A8K0GNN8_9ROSA|nr:hypothetical protein FNV43_RR23981 [Rhamnella rubrinervis]
MYEDLMFGYEKQHDDWVKFDVCTELPPLVNSENNIWSKKRVPQDKKMMTNSMAELEVIMALMFFSSQAVHFVLRHFGLPKIASQIISGIILSFALVDSNGQPRLENLFTRTGQELVGTLSMFGYQLFLFLTAVKMDLGTILRTRKKAAIIGVAAPLVPFFFGMGIKPALQTHLRTSEKTKLTNLVVAQSITSFPVISSLIIELNILTSEFGRLALTASMVSDVVSFCLANIVSLAETYKLQGFLEALKMFSIIIGFIIVVIFIIRPMMFWIIKRTPEGRPVKNVYVYTIILLALSSGLLSNIVGAYVFLGPYILGLAIPDGPPLGSAVIDKLDSFVSGVFLPLLMVSTGMRVDCQEMKFDKMILSSMVIIILTYLVKLVTCLLPCMYYKMPTLDSLALSLIMSSQGIVELSLYSMLRDNNQLDDGTYGLVLFTILAIVIVGPISVKYLYDPSRKYAGYQKRNIMHLKPNSELRIVSCINRPDDIPSTINLLDNSCPTKENPITVYVLHLIELIGRASPIFISHQMQQKVLSNISYSANMILSFGRFERDNWGTVTVNSFTSVSPPNLMHDDICTMALDKLASLIILPFHREWSMDGTVELDDNMVRTLNCSVLDKAPCSVGILVNRGQVRRRPANSDASPAHAHVYSVCVIFLGGKDDREALVYAKRMAKDQSINVMVLHFLAPKDLPEEPKMKWEHMMDSELLKDVRNSNLSTDRQGYMGYMAKVVKDGSEMALIVRNLVDDYDLIITGRRYGVDCPQTSGLMEWSEFPELGVVGDLLASTDNVFGRASVLVLQQQVTD